MFCDYNCWCLLAQIRGTELVGSYFHFVPNFDWILLYKCTNAIVLVAVLLKILVPFSMFFGQRIPVLVYRISIFPEKPRFHTPNSWIVYLGRAKRRGYRGQFYEEGPEGEKWELAIVYFFLRKWGLMNWDIRWPTSVMSTYFFRVWPNIFHATNYLFETPVIILCWWLIHFSGQI